MYKETKKQSTIKKGDKIMKNILLYIENIITNNPTIADNAEKIFNIKLAICISMIFILIPLISITYNIIKIIKHIRGL